MRQEGKKVVSVRQGGVPHHRCWLVGAAARKGRDMKGSGTGFKACLGLTLPGGSRLQRYTLVLMTTLTLD